MKKLVPTILTLLAVFAFTGCVEQEPEDVPVVDEYPPLTIEVAVGDATETITPEWLQLENGSCIARDTDTGMLYAGNEIGEYAPYSPDLPTVENLSKYDLPESFTPIDETNLVTPIWLQLDNGSVIARDTDTGMLYAGNEVGEYAPYLPDLPVCE